MRKLIVSLKEEIKSWDRESVLFVIGGVCLACLVLGLVI